MFLTLPPPHGVVTFLHGLVVMDPTPDEDETVRSDPAPPQLDGADASVGEKRAVVVENGGDQGSSKKPRLVCGTGGGDLKRVAEIVLVLSTMSNIRGGKKPTDLEVGLMAEARAKLVELCQGLAPKDIVARDAIGAVIEDLGLNGNLKDQRLGFLGPKLTIAERLSATKKKVWCQFLDFAIPRLRDGIM